MSPRASNNQQYIYWLSLFHYEDPVVLGYSTEPESNKNLILSSDVASNPRPMESLATLLQNLLLHYALQHLVCMLGL